MEIRTIRVEDVWPKGITRKEVGVQRLKIVTIMTDSTRYAAVFYRDHENKMRTRATWRNGEAFNKSVPIWIPQEVFSAMTKTAGAVMFGPKAQKPLS